MIPLSWSNDVDSVGSFTRLRFISVVTLVADDDGKLSSNDVRNDGSFTILRLESVVTFVDASGTLSNDGDCRGGLKRLSLARPGDKIFKTNEKNHEILFFLL